MSQPPLSTPPVNSRCCSGLRNLREAQNREEEEEEKEEKEEEPSDWGSSLVERMPEVERAPRRRLRSTQGWRGPGSEQTHLMAKKIKSYDGAQKKNKYKGIQRNMCVCV